MSFFGGADDDTYTVFSEGGDVETGPVGPTEGLHEEAVSAQRLSILRMFREHVHGRAHVSVVDPRRKLVPEKLFNIDNLIEWESGDPDVVLDKLAQGRVRARLSANMGLGKTTKLAPTIARKLECRVLLVSIDALCLRQATEYSTTLGLGKYRKNWPTKKGEALCYMTYADFCGYMVGGDRSRLFGSFDVFIFDEAFVGRDDVFTAKRAFSAFAHPENSLLLASATIRRDNAGAMQSSSGLGAFIEASATRTVEEVIAGGRLVSEFLVDRTVVFCPTDAQVELMFDHYEINGVDCKVLESFASYDELMQVSEWLTGDATTQRVLVAHVSFGIGFNLPVSYSVIFPQREIVVVEDGKVHTRLEPLCEQMVTQLKSRTGRAIIPGSGGLVMSPDRAPATDLYPDCVVKAFVRMCASGIVPMRNGFWSAAYKVFPDGLTPALAARILKVGMPVEVTARFFAADGLVANRFTAALNFFSQPDHFLMASAEKEAVGVETWLPQHVRTGELGVDYPVPVEAEGELRVVIHSVLAIANGDFRVERWRPPVQRALGGYESDGETNEVVITAKRLRRVTIEPPKEVEVAPQQIGWYYRPNGEIAPPEKRSGKYMDSERFREAIAKMDSIIAGYSVPKSAVEVAPSPVDAEKVEFDIPVVSHVESPGGSHVCTLPRVAAEKLNCGQILEPSEFLDVIWSTKPVQREFVASRMFDNFAGPWEAMLRTVAQPDVLDTLVRGGEASVTFRMIDFLRGRFNTELLAVLRTSNLIRTRFRRLFARPPSPESVMAAILAGDFSNIAQTSGFFERVAFLKRLMDKSLIAAENACVYLPNHVTAAQRMQYVAPSRIGYVGKGLHPPHAPQPPSPSLRRMSRTGIGSSEEEAQHQRLRDRMSPPRSGGSVASSNRTIGWR